MTRQVFTTAHSAKNGVGKFTAEAAHHGTVPHYHHFHAAVRKFPLQARIQAQHRHQVLFPCQAPHHAKHHFIPPHAPGLTERGIPPGRIKQGGIHPAPHHGEAFKPQPFQRTAHLFRGHYRHPRLVVQLAQVIHGGVFQPGEMVILHVLVEVGVESHHHGNLQSAGGLDGGRPHGAFRGYVNHIRPLLHPSGAEPVCGRQPYLHFMVHGKGEGRHGRLPGKGSPVPLGRPQHMHQVPPRPEPPDQTPQSHGHSIHIRLIRIRCHVNSHAPEP